MLQGKGIFFFIIKMSENMANLFAVIFGKFFFFTMENSLHEAFVDFVFSDK